MIENDDYKISPYFWKCLSGCSRFCHTAAFTVTRAQARMCSATLASTNEGGPCASHDCTVCTFCRSKYMLKLAQTTFNMKTEHIKWVLHAHTHTHTHTCIVFVMELRISKMAASRSCRVGYISIFSSSKVKAMRKSGKRW